MKYVFLDIDGVLNHADFFERLQPLEKFNGMDEVSNRDIGFASLDEDCVRRLNGLVVPGVVFVISSTWRIIHPLHHIQGMLKDKGFEGVTIGSTPVSIGKRGREISSWLAAATGAFMFDRARSDTWPDFVILDDDSDMLHLNNYLVQVDNATGLQQEHIDQAWKRLGLDS